MGNRRTSTGGPCQVIRPGQLHHIMSRQRQLAQIIAAFNANIEGAKLDFLVVLAGNRRCRPRRG